MLHECNLTIKKAAWSQTYVDIKWGNEADGTSWTCYYVSSGARWIQALTERPKGGIPRCVWHHLHHGEDRGAEESVQRPGGRTAQADELRLDPHRHVWHHEAALHPRLRKYVCIKTTSHNSVHSRLQPVYSTSAVSQPPNKFSLLNLLLVLSWTLYYLPCLDGFIVSVRCLFML